MDRRDQATVRVPKFPLKRGMAQSEAVKRYRTVTSLEVPPWLMVTRSPHQSQPLAQRTP
jgi:hypothetical protein